jgi:hypothetical protein
MDFDKAKPPQAGHQLSRLDIVEEGRVRAAENCYRWGFRVEHAPALANVIRKDFSLLRAALDAFAAADAAFGDDLGVVAVNTDRLDRAVADTGVALATVLLDGMYRTHSAPGE